MQQPVRRALPQERQWPERRERPGAWEPEPQALQQEQQVRRELQGQEPEQRASQPEFRQALPQELQELLREQRKRRGPLQAWSAFQQWRQPSSREPSSKLP